MDSGEISIEIKQKYIMAILAFTIAIILFPIQNEFLWSILVVITGSFFVVMYRKTEEDILINEKYAKRIIIVLVVAGFLLRIYEINTLSFWHDEAVTANIVKSLLENGVPAYPSGKMYTRELFNLLLLALSSKIFGYNDWALRLPSAIAGTLTIALTYFTSRNFFDREVGLISAVFITFSTWQITWSNQVRMYGLLQLLFLSTIFMIYYNFSEDTSYGQIAFLLVTMILSIFTHLIGYILPFVLVGYSILIFIQTDRQLKSLIYIITPIIVVFIFINLFYQNMIELTFSWLDYNTSNFSLYLDWLVANYHVMLGLGIVGGFIGLKENLKATYLSFISILPIFVVFFWFWDNPGSRYLFVVFPFFAIFSGLLISKASHIMCDTYSKDSLTRSIILITLIISTLFFGNFVSGDYEPGLRAPQADFRSSYNYVGDKIRDDDVLISSWTAPTVYYLREPDYALIPKNLVQGNTYKGKDYYSGAPIINGSEELRSVIENSKRGWIVLDERAYGSQGEDRKRIIGKLVKVNKSSEFKEVTVWKWTENTNLN